MRHLAVTLAIVLVAPCALADRDKAAAAYKQGTAAFAKGSFAEAAAAFDTAYAEDPRGASVYNGALAWQGAKDDARAADDFARAVASTDLRADLADNAKAQLAQLEAKLGRVSITGPANAHFVVAHASGSLPARVHLAPAHYVVRATYDGGTSGDFSVDVSAGAEAPVDVTPHVVVLPPQPPPPVPMRARGIFGPSTLPISIALIGAGAVAAGFSIGLGVAAVDSLAEFKASGYTSVPPHDRAVQQRDVSNAMLVTAVVFGAVGITALVTIHKVRVQAALGPSALVLRGTF